MKGKKRISILAVLVCLFALVLSLGLMSACGNTDDNTTSSNQWYYGAEVPADTLGHEGDYYLNTQTLASYVKSDDGTWTETAANWYYGTEAPVANLGATNDFYLNTKTGELYQKNASDWGFPILTLKGESGKPGRDGVLWFSGNGDPNTLEDKTILAGSIKGDFYIDHSTWTVYQLLESGTWTPLGSLVGGTGARGAKWFYGSALPEVAPEIVDVQEGDSYFRTYVDDETHTENYRIYYYEKGEWTVKTTVVIEKIDDALFGSNNEEYFTDNGETVVIEKVDKGAADVTIPGQLNGKPVEIGKGVFSSNKTLTSVTLEEGVIGIGSQAFMLSGITDITIPASVKEIGDNAFTYCQSLNEITLPEGVESLGSGSFAGCGFENVTIPASVTEIGNNAFGSCTSLHSVTFAEGTQLDTIPEAMFDKCSQLKSVEIPDSVTTIGEDAFRNSGLETITIPANVEVIEADAFRGDANGPSQLTSIIFATDGNLKEIGDRAFYGTEHLPSVEFPASVEKIGAQAFNQSGVTSVTFAENSACKEILDECFVNCESLETLEFPEGIEHIGKDIVYNTAIYNTPVNWETISANGTEKWSCLIVDGCLIKLKKINDGIANITSDLVNSAEKLTALIAGGNYTLTLPEGIRIISESFSCVRKLSGSNLTSTDDSDSAIKSYVKVVIPYTVEYISNYAFNYNTNIEYPVGKVTCLAEIEIVDTAEHHSKLKSIGTAAFSSYQTKIRKINIPDSVTHIGANAFGEPSSGESPYRVLPQAQIAEWTQTENGGNTFPVHYKYVIDSEEVKISTEGWYSADKTAEEMTQPHANNVDYNGSGRTFVSWFSDVKDGNPVTEFWFSLYTGVELWR